MQIYVLDRDSCQGEKNSGSMIKLSSFVFVCNANHESILEIRIKYLLCTYTGEIQKKGKTINRKNAA